MAGLSGSIISTPLHWTFHDVENSQVKDSPEGQPPHQPPHQPLAAHDAQLVAIKAGDAGVFDALCLAVAEPLWRFAAKLTGSSEAGQDIVQDVLIDLWARRHEVEITHSVTAYLFGAVRRRAFVYLRNAGTASRISATWTPENIPAIGTIANRPDTQLERDETAALVRDAVAGLPSIRRQAILLRWRDRLSYDDIAAALGISIEAARAHVSRGYRALRGVLREAGVEGV